MTILFHLFHQDHQSIFWFADCFLLIESSQGRGQKEKASSLVISKGLGGSTKSLSQETASASPSSAASSGHKVSPHFLGPAWPLWGLGSLVAHPQRPVDWPGPRICRVQMRRGRQSAEDDDLVLQLDTALPPVMGSGRDAERIGVKGVLESSQHGGPEGLG